MARLAPGLGPGKATGACTHTLSTRTPTRRPWEHASCHPAPARRARLRPPDQARAHGASPTAGPMAPRQRPARAHAPSTRNQTPPPPHPLRPKPYEPASTPRGDDHEPGQPRVRPRARAASRASPRRRRHLRHLRIRRRAHLALLTVARPRTPRPHTRCTVGWRSEDHQDNLTNSTAVHGRDRASPAKPPSRSTRSRRSGGEVSASPPNLDIETAHSSPLDGPSGPQGES